MKMKSWAAGTTSPARLCLVLGLALALSLLPAPRVAAARGEMPPELRTALERLDAGDAEGALASAEALLAARPDGPFAAAAALLAGRAELALGQPDRALARALAVLEREAAGPMAAQAHYLLATVHEARGESYDAARELVACLNAGALERVAAMAARRLAGLAAGPVRYRAGTLRALARSSAARAALDTLAAPPAENPRIGIIVQQESEEDTTARDLLVGARAAVKVDEQAGGRGELVVRTVPCGAPEAVFAARTLVRREGVWALVISGRESDAIAAAVEAQAAGIPVVLPGRRRPDLYLAGPTVFMPEADWEREGAIAAMYAADSLHLRTFAVVAPATDLGRYLVEGFTKTLEARDSCEVLAVEWYFPEEGVSVSRQFLRIREIGFRRAFLDSLGADSVWHDSLWVADTTGGRDTTLLDSALWKRLWRTHLDSIRRTPAFKVGAIDSNAIELKTIEGLYFPIEPGTIELFAPQFAFYNFRAVKMGNAGWYDPEELYHQRQYTEDLVFTAPYRLEETEGVMAELATEVYRETGGAVHPWNIRGFDGVRMLLTAAGGRSGPAGTAEGLKRLKTLDLAAGRQVFDSRRHVGLGMWLLTVVEGAVRVEDPARRRLLLSPPADLDESAGAGRSPGRRR